MLTREGGAPGDDPSLDGAAEAAADLLQSSAVAEPAATNLRLDDSPDELLDRIGVETSARSSLLHLTVNADEREEARRTAQELAEVFSVLYNTRFGPAVTASVWEGARPQEDPVSPRPLLNLALGALLGAAVGVAIAALGRSGAPASAAPAPPAPVADARYEERIAALTARERALARRAAEVSMRERELAEGRALEQEAEPKPEPEPESEPEPEPAAPEPAAPAEPFVRPGLGEWMVDDVERLVAQHGPAFPDRAEELRTYVESMRGVAEPDGRLPAGVEVVIEDVFADLLEQSAAPPDGRA